jgi:hypothetical protein
MLVQAESSSMAPVGVDSLNRRRKWSYIGNFECRSGILSPVGLPSKLYTRSWVGQHLESKSSPDGIVEGIRYYDYLVSQFLCYFLVASILQTILHFFSFSS